MKSIFSEDYKSIINALKKARTSKGLTQKQLSQKLGHTQSYISKIEQGQIRLDIVQLKRISKILDEDIQRLIK